MGDAPGARRMSADLHERVAELEAEVARLRAALKPFADAAAEIEPHAKDEWETDFMVVLTNGHIRAAAAALRPMTTEE